MNKQIEFFNKSATTYMNFDSLTMHENEEGDIYLKCKASQDFLDQKDGGLAVALLDESSLDFMIAGEDGCISNFDMYSILYNSWMDLVFLIPYSTSEEFMLGAEVNICGREPEEDDREYLIKEYDMDIEERGVPDNV